MSSTITLRIPSPVNRPSRPVWKPVQRQERRYKLTQRVYYEAFAHITGPDNKNLTQISSSADHRCYIHPCPELSQFIIIAPTLQAINMTVRVILHLQNEWLQPIIAKYTVGETVELDMFPNAVNSINERIRTLARLTQFDGQILRKDTQITILTKTTKHLEQMKQYISENAEGLHLIPRILHDEL